MKGFLVIKTHSIESSRCAIGPENILFAGGSSHQSFRPENLHAEAVKGLMARCYAIYYITDMRSGESIESVSFDLD